MTPNDHRPRQSYMSLDACRGSGILSGVPWVQGCQGVEGGFLAAFEVCGGPHSLLPYFRSRFSLGVGVPAT